MVDSVVQVCIFTGFSMYLFTVLLLTTEKRILKFLIITDLSISPFIPVGFCFMCTEALFLGAYTHLGLLSAVDEQRPLYTIT